MLSSAVPLSSFCMIRDYVIDYADILRSRSERRTVEAYGSRGLDGEKQV